MDSIRVLYVEDDPPTGTGRIVTSRVTPPHIKLTVAARLRRRSSASPSAMWTCYSRAIAFDGTALDLLDAVKAGDTRCRSC